jgi:hypothetical protein
MGEIVAQGLKVRQIIDIPSTSSGAVARSDTVLALTKNHRYATQSSGVHGRVRPHPSSRFRA